MNRDNFFDMPGKLKSGIFISAYTDIELLNDFLDRFLDAKDGRGHPQIQVFLDLAASGYRGNQAVRNKIDTLAQKIRKECNKKSGIWLVQCGKLFHSKCVVLDSTSQTKIIIGSLNLTGKAFEGNEELVLVGKGSRLGRSNANKMANEIREVYVPALMESGISVPSKDCVAPNSLRSLLLSGAMFYEQKEADPFSFNLGLPKEFCVIPNQYPLLDASFANTISVKKLLYSDKSSGGLGYDFRRHNNTDDEVRNKSHWKHLCFETCYGYWCQGDLIEDAQCAIEQRAKIRTPYFEDKTHGLFPLLQQENVRDELTKAFLTFIDTIDVGQHQWSSKEVECRWGLWLDRLNEKTKNETFHKRIKTGIIQAAVPNVWSDPITSFDFEISFAGSVRYASQKNTESMAYRNLKQKLHLDAAELEKSVDEESMLAYLNKQIDSDSVKPIE